MRTLTKALIGILFIAVAIYILSQLIVESYIVANPSMEPSLQRGEHVLINKMAYRFNEPGRGEVICYRTIGGSLEQVKRVIGLPGDVIEIKDGDVYVNGHSLTEPYVKNPTALNLPAYQVQPNYYFVLEDNRSLSLGPVAESAVQRGNILGRAWVLAWPPDKWGSIDHYHLDSQLTTAEAP